MNPLSELGTPSCIISNKSEVRIMSEPRLFINEGGSGEWGLERSGTLTFSRSLKLDEKFDLSPEDFFFSFPQSSFSSPLPCGEREGGRWEERCFFHFIINSLSVVLETPVAGEEGWEAQEYQEGELAKEAVEEGEEGVEKEEGGRGEGKQEKEAE